jgi:glycine cleavage system regulatory protein
MNKTLVITVLATDRPGIVKTISKTLVAHNGTWLDSRMMNLADKFAGLLHVSVPENQLVKLKEALQVLHETDNQLQVLMEEADEVAATPESHLSLELLGADRPGIIDDITEVLTRLKVNINNLETEQRTASMSSEILFYANLELGLPEGVSDEDVQDALEALSDQLMVDIDFGEL